MNSVKDVSTMNRKFKDGKQKTEGFRTPAFSRIPKHTQKETLKKITDREQGRLGSSGVVNTRHFQQRQTFGSASGVTHINPKDITPEELQRLVSS